MVVDPPELNSVSGTSRRSRGLLSRERLIAGLVAFVFLAVCLFVGLRWFEHMVSFHPARSDARGEGWAIPTGAQEVWLTTKDNIRLHGWSFETSKQPAIATVIFFHGNGGNISNVVWVGERLATRGLNVLLLDYRGYGRSEGAVIDERGLYTDADAGYDYITKMRGIRPETVVLYGQSLGTAVVADLGSRKKCGAVILESGMSSASDLATTVLPLLPRSFHFLARNRFDSARKLANVSCPILITHGDPDSTIPAEHARLLFKAANEPKKLIIFPGAGHNVFGSEGDRYLELLADFVRAAIEKDR